MDCKTNTSFVFIVSSATIQNSFPEQFPCPGPLPCPGHLTSCKAISFILYILVVSSTHCNAPILYKLLTFHVPI